MEENKPTFVFWYPHPMHKMWSDSITDTHTSFLPEAWLETFRLSPSIIHQFLAALTFWRIPKANTYLIENMICMLPTYLRSPKSKRILMNCDNFFDTYKNTTGIKRKIYTWLMSKIDGYISNSELSRQTLSKYIDVPNKVVYPGINSKFFSINPDFNSNNIAHGMSGIKWQKGSDIMIEAYNKLQNPKGHLYLIGPMALDGFVKDNVTDIQSLKEIKTIDESQPIISTGFVDKPEQYLTKCEIFVNPARYEPFGMNILEAMAAGFAPIVSVNCGAKVIVEQIDKHLIIQPTPLEIIKTIKWLNQGNRKQDLGIKAKQIASKYTIKTSVDNFKQKFQELLSEI